MLLLNEKFVSSASYIKYFPTPGDCFENACVRIDHGIRAVLNGVHHHKFYFLLTVPKISPLFWKMHFFHFFEKCKTSNFEVCTSLIISRHRTVCTSVYIAWPRSMLFVHIAWPQSMHLVYCCPAERRSLAGGLGRGSPALSRLVASHLFRHSFKDGAHVFWLLAEVKHIHCRTARLRERTKHIEIEWDRAIWPTNAKAIA